MKAGATLLLAALVVGTAGFKPVIMMHGVGDNAKEMTTIARVLQDEHPGTVATSLKLYEDSPASWDHSLMAQVQGVAKAIRNLTATSPQVFADGYHLVCHSQGALICRCVVEYMDDHNVDTLVALAGPQVGVFGPSYFAFIKDTLHLPQWLEKTAMDAMWLVADEPLGQLLSVGGYWHDPRHEAAYQRAVTLAGFNEKATAAYKANFLRLGKAVFYIGSGPSFDGGVEPWQTGLFGFPDGAGGMKNMTDQPFFTQDSFGLKTLYGAGRLELHAVPGVPHNHWTYDEATVRKYIVQYCT